MLYTVPGWGKTSFAAQADKVLFFMSRGETGLLTLSQHDQIPETPFMQFQDGHNLVPDARSWQQVLQAIDALLHQDHDYKWIAFDTLNGIERLCHEHVCQKEFAGNWGENGFAAYQRGYDISIAYWLEFLNLLNKLRDERGIGTISLCHVANKTIKNPLGADYDSFLPDMHLKTWAKTSGWADIILFGRFELEVLQAKTDATKKGKARGGKNRIIYTTHCAGWDAKNRHGLPDYILISNESAAQAWQDFKDAFSNKENA